jgi:hypothetical protein
MTVALLILAALVLPASMLFLSLSVNDFEKHAKALVDILVKRYTIEPPKPPPEKEVQKAPIMKIIGKT